MRRFLQVLAVHFKRLRGLVLFHVEIAERLILGLGRRVYGHGLLVGHHRVVYCPGFCLACRQQRKDGVVFGVQLHGFLVVRYGLGACILLLIH